MIRTLCLLAAAALFAGCASAPVTATPSASVSPLTAGPPAGEFTPHLGTGTAADPVRFAY